MLKTSAPFTDTLDNFTATVDRPVVENPIVLSTVCIDLIMSPNVVQSHIGARLEHRFIQTYDRIRYSLWVSFKRLRKVLS